MTTQKPQISTVPARARQLHARPLRTAKRPAKNNGFPIALAPIALLGLTGIAIAAPPAFALNVVNDPNLGALAIIIPLALLFSTLVVQVWRETARNAMPDIDRQMKSRRANSRKQRIQT